MPFPLAPVRLFLARDRVRSIGGEASVVCGVLDADSSFFTPIANNIIAADGIASLPLEVFVADNCGNPLEGVVVELFLAEIAVNAALSSVSVTPATIPNNNSDLCTVFIFVKDAAGLPIQGATVTIAVNPATGVTITQPAAVTNSAGVATATFKSSEIDTVTVSALVDGSVSITQTQDVEVSGTALVWGFDPAANGLEAVVYRHFNSRAANGSDRGTGNFPSKVGGSEGWDAPPDEVSGTNISLVDDQSDMLMSPPNAMRIRYPVGHPPNNGPGVVQTQGFDAAVHGSKQYVELYTRTGFKLGANYHIGTVGNKFFFHRTKEKNNRRSEPFMAFLNSGGGLFKIGVNFQGTKDNGLGFFFGSGIGAALDVSIPYRLETYLKYNSDVDTADGVFRAWIDGTLIIERTNVNYYQVVELVYLPWSVFHVSPTFGNDQAPGGPNNQSEFDIFIDAVLIWGKQ
jgi:hypothetical protein